MKLDLLPDVLVSSLVLGSTYTLIALTWVIVFRATKVLNFATGQFLLLGGYIFFTFTITVKLPFLPALLITLLLSALFGAVVYLLLLRPLAGQPIYSPVIVTMGLSIIMASAMPIFWGSGNLILKKPVRNHVYALPGHAFVTTYGIATVVVTLLVFFGLLAFLRFSRLGIQMRAAAEHPLLASQTGININVMFVLGWMLTAAIGTIPALSYALTNALSPTAMGQLGLRGLAPVLVGGLDSVEGVIIAGFFVALVENLAVLYLGAGVKDAAAFTVLLVFLVIKPYGLFGTPEIQRV